MDSRQCKILIVDDDEDDYVLTRQMLSEANRDKYILEWASSYSEGRSALHHNRYDAVLMDYDLGAHTGLELIREAVQHGYKDAFILYTGRGSYEVDLEAMQAGVSMYLTKGETSAFMLERGIRYAIERKQTEDALYEKSQQMQALFDSSDVGMVLFEAAYPFEILTNNRTFQAWWGKDGESQGFQGRSMGEYALSAENDYGLLDYFHQVADSQRPLHLEEFYFDGMGGGPRWFNWSLSPILRNEKTIALAFTAVDVSDEVQARQQMQAVNLRQTLLAEAAAELLAGADPIVRLEDFFQRFSSMLGLEVYVQYNLAPDGNHLILGSIAGFPARYMPILSKLDLGQAVCGTVAQIREPMYVFDVQRRKDRRTRLIRSLGITAYACHPLIVQNRLLGTLSFGSRQHTHFDDETIGLLRTFCSLVASALARKQDEAALRRSEQHTRQVLDSLFAFVGVLNPQGIVLEANRAPLQAANLNLEDVVGLPFENTYWWSYSPEVQAMIRAAIEQGKQGDSPRFDIDVQIGHEKFLMIDFMIAPLRNEIGQITHLIASGVDVSQRKAAEEELRTQAHQLQTITDATSRQNAVLTGITRIFKDAGHCETEELLGELCLQIVEGVTQSQFSFLGEIDPNSDGLEAIAIRNSLRDDEPESERNEQGQRLFSSFRLKGEYGEMIRKGQSFYTNQEMVLARDLILDCFLGVPLLHAGKLTGILGLANRPGGYGLNEQQAAEALAAAIIQALVSQRADEKLKTYAEQLERSNRELEHFAYAASHDLQEPLRKIEMFGSQLGAKALHQLGSNELDYLQRMQNATRRMRMMIDDLLELSRVTADKPKMQAVDLNHVIRVVQEDLEPRLRQTGGQLLVEELPSVLAEPIQMHQLFQNLVGNALKFHKPDIPPVVRLFPCALDKKQGGAYIEICVEDNGVGFDMQQAYLLFQPFQRLHSKAEYEGTGMGLAICRKIAERYGGSLHAYSQPGEGSRFTVTLRLANGEF